MITAILAFAFMLVVVAGMAIGVMFGRKPISGSCGGMKALGMNMECEICGGDPSRCESDEVSGDSRASLAHRLAVDATRADR